ncbi:N-acetyltransferase family protein [Emcibacter sp. SYSU 3D8]|uniref:GNAT family N-acetyltransferase n=1 Tax=Emcibacter sp. SYSU 3D8 TaxID=3133969 RepID=UPI0031FE7832
MDVKIENALADDLPAIAVILNEAIENTTSVWYDEPRTRDWMDAWFELKRLKGWPVLVARGEGRVLGYASYGEFRPHTGYRGTREHSVYVDGSVRGMGIGRMLLGTLIARARDNGVHILVGGIADENAASIALHRSLGFSEVARMPEVGQKFDRWLTLVLMQKIL